MQNFFVVANFKFYQNHISKSNVITGRRKEESCRAKLCNEEKALNVCDVNKTLIIIQCFLFDVQSSSTIEHLHDNVGPSGRSFTHEEDVNLKLRQSALRAKTKVTGHPHENPSKIIRKKLADFNEENGLAAVDISRIWVEPKIQDIQLPNYSLHAKEFPTVVLFKSKHYQQIFPLSDKRIILLITKK